MYYRNVTRISQSLNYPKQNGGSNQSQFDHYWNNARILKLPTYALPYAEYACVYN